LKLNPVFCPEPSVFVYKLRPHDILDDPRLHWYRSGSSNLARYWRVILWQ